MKTTIEENKNLRQETAQTQARNEYAAEQLEQLPAACAYVPFPEEKAYFDLLFAKADATHSGQISGGIAVVFLLTSRLPKEVLKGIWNIADCNKLSFLRRQDFYVAMRLISMAQVTHPQFTLINSLYPIALMTASSLTDR